jgi:hypothetical protein
VAALAWEHERATTDALARRVTEAEHFLHASEVEHIASSSHQAPPTAPLQQSVGPQLGQVDPMVAYLHLQTVGVPHIKNPVTVVLDSTSTSYARWRDQVLLALRRYALDDHVLSDTPVEARDLTWRRPDSTVMSWIFGTISLDLQDIVRTPNSNACNAWLALESQFLGNAQTRALQLDAKLRTLEQGDLSVAEFCRKMKRTADALRDLGYPVPEHVLVLNVLRDLLGSYEAVRTLLTHQQPTPTFLRARDALTLEELTRGLHTPASTMSSSSTSRALVAAPPPSSACLSPWCSSPRAERGWRGPWGPPRTRWWGTWDARPGSDPRSCSPSRRCALADPNWRRAMEEEYEALLANQTRDLVSRPSGCNVMTGKWILDDQASC